MLMEAVCLVLWVGHVVYEADDVYGVISSVPCGVQCIHFC